MRRSSGKLVQDRIQISAATHANSGKNVSAAIGKSF